MAGSITIPFWPTTLDCLSWSRDNQLAVAGGEQVAILSPRLGSSGANNTHWDTTVFRVNGFTAAEIPVQEPLSFENFDVGEELSTRHVQALKWSPPGLGRYAKCVLAILSSNHALSIWECDGKPDVSRNWNRKSVLNNFVKSYYEDAGGINEGDHELKQVRQRIHAFCWAPALRAKTGQPLDGHLDRGEHFLAIATGRGEIMILRVRSPYSGLSSEDEEWKFTVIHRIDLHAELANDNVATASSANAPKVAAVSWSSWLHRPGSASSVFALSLAGKLYYFTATSEQKPPNEWDWTLSKLQHLTDGSGPFCWSPKRKATGEVDGGTVWLVAFGSDAALCAELTTSGTKSPVITQHHLDGRWDEISGAAVTYATKAEPKLHVTSLLSSATAPTAKLSLPLDSDEVSEHCSWQDAIVESQAVYSAENSLGAKVLSRTWGIAASPLGDLIATCCTIHPADSVAYVIQSDQACIVNVTRVDEVSDHNFLPADGGASLPEEVSAETMLYSAQRYMERTPRPSLSQEQTMENMLRSCGIALASLPGLQSPLPKADEHVKLVRYIRLNLLFHADTLRARFLRLAAFATDGARGQVMQEQQIVKQLTETVLRLPHQLCDGSPMSRKILRQHSIVLSRLRALEGAADDLDIDASQAEECAICGLPVAFESVRWARCGGGHQFSKPLYSRPHDEANADIICTARCSLTFLSIQQPGISKFCRICNTQCLDRHLIIKRRKWDDIEMSDTAADGLGSPWILVKQGPQEPANSLADLLFAAVDLCIYCGGKFASG